MEDGNADEPEPRRLQAMNMTGQFTKGVLVITILAFAGVAKAADPIPDPVATYAELTEQALVEAAKTIPRASSLVAGSTTLTLPITVNGIRYQLECSEDLIYWYRLGEWEPFMGNGAAHTETIGHDAETKRMFYRYALDSPDQDGDGLSAWAEAQLGTSDLNKDTDGDGASDVLELKVGTDPLSSGSYPWLVVSAEPAPGLYGHYPDAAVVLHLNKPLPASVTTIPLNFLFQIMNDGSEVAATGSTTILPGRKSIAFLPSPNLANRAANSGNYNYHLNVTQQTINLSLFQPYESYFATADMNDTTGPWVGRVYPGENYTDVAPDFIPEASFSQALLPSTVGAANVTFKETVSGVSVPCTVSFDYENYRLRLAPTYPLNANSSYTIILGVGFKNLMGKPLLNPFSWHFSTRPARTSIVTGAGPYVTNTNPPDFSNQVPLSTTTLTITFSEAMDASTLNSSTVHLVNRRTGTSVGVSLNYDPTSKTLTITPNSALSSGNGYEIKLDNPNIHAASSNGTGQPLQGGGVSDFKPKNTPPSSSGDPEIAPPPDEPADGEGTPDDNDAPPIKLHLHYGDDDYDAGGAVKISITRPDGSNQDMQAPMTKNSVREYETPALPFGSIVKLTPTFQKGSDPDYDEEINEVGVTVSVSSGSGDSASGYKVFEQESSSNLKYLGQLNAGSYTFYCRYDADDGTRKEPQVGVVSPDTVNVNDTETEKDDIVRKETKVANTYYRQWVPCTVLIAEAGKRSITSITATATGGALKFTQDQGAEPGADVTPTADVQVTLDASGKGRFYVTGGTTQSTDKGDVTLEIHKDSATGALLVSKAMTVFWYQPTLTITGLSSPSGNTASISASSDPNGGADVTIELTNGVSFNAAADVIPTGLDCKAPQISSWILGVVQDSTARRISYAGGPYIKSALPSGETLKVVNRLTHPLVSFDNELDIRATKTSREDDSPLVNGDGLLNDGQSNKGADPASIRFANKSNEGHATYSATDAPQHVFYTAGGKTITLTTSTKPSGTSVNVFYPQSTHEVHDSFPVWAGLYSLALPNSPQGFIPLLEHSWKWDVVYDVQNSSVSGGSSSTGNAASPQHVPVLVPPITGVDGGQQNSDNQAKPWQQDGSSGTITPPVQP